MLRGFLMALALYSGTIKDCSPDGSLATIEAMGLNPVSPQPGDNTTTWVMYDLPTTVTGGTVKYSYWLNFIPFTPDVIDLCSQEICPLESGVYNVSGSVSFPDVSGRLETRIEWFDQDETPMWCVDTIFSI